LSQKTTTYRSAATTRLGQQHEKSREQWVLISAWLTCVVLTFSRYEGQSKNSGNLSIKKNYRNS
jgi:hypothetical protein